MPTFISPKTDKTGVGIVKVERLIWYYLSRLKITLAADICDTIRIISEYKLQIGIGSKAGVPFASNPIQPFPRTTSAGPAYAAPQLKANKPATAIDDILRMARSLIWSDCFRRKTLALALNGQRNREDGHTLLPGQ